MRRRSLVLLVVNLLISIVVAVAIVSLLQSRQQPTEPQQIVITVPILVTATLDPVQATQTPFIITATSLPGTNVVALPTGLIELTAQPRLGDGSPIPSPNFDPTLLAGNSDLSGTLTSLPSNCIPYTLQSGDTPSSIGAEYGVDFSDILAVNGLSEADAQFLQIGQILTIPLEGCELAAEALIASQTATGLPTQTPTITPGGPTATLTPSNTPRPTRTATLSPSETAAPSTNTPLPTGTATRTSVPSPTLPPTAINAQVVIVGITGTSALDSESIEIRNNGSTAALQGWTLRTSAGDIYTFPNKLLFSQASVTVNTRTGTDTPIALFWNRAQPTFSSGTTVTLSDNAGEAQSVYTVP